MAQYIDKSALVTEIERRIKNLYPKGGQGMVVTKILKDHYEDLLDFINALEVKGVDLESEIENVRKSHFINSDFDKATLDGRNITNIAKHFYELGLKARTDKELVEEVYSHLDSIKDTADRMTSGNFMHNRAAIKFSANTIAKVLELMGLKAQKGE